MGAGIFNIKVTMTRQWCGGWEMVPAPVPYHEGKMTCPQVAYRYVQSSNAFWWQHTIPSEEEGKYLVVSSAGGSEISRRRECVRPCVHIPMRRVYIITRYSTYRLECIPATNLASIPSLYHNLFLIVLMRKNMSQARNCKRNDKGETGKSYIRTCPHQSVDVAEKHSQGGIKARCTHSL